MTVTFSDAAARALLAEEEQVGCPLYSCGGGAWPRKQTWAGQRAFPGTSP